MVVKEQKALFLSKKGLPISRSSLAEMITKYAKQSGLEKQVTPHTFRRSCATGMIKNSANLMHVKELLGHKSLDMTQRYAHHSPESLRSSISVLDNCYNFATVEEGTV